MSVAGFFTNHAELDDDDFKVCSDHCETILNKWVALLGLQDWRKSYVFHRTPFARDDDVRPGLITLAYCESDWRYMSFTVHVACCHAFYMPSDFLEQNLIHELLHPILDELEPFTSSSTHDMEDWNNHNERVVTSLALGLWNAMKHVDQIEETEV